MRNPTWITESSAWFVTSSGQKYSFQDEINSSAARAANGARRFGVMTRYRSDLLPTPSMQAASSSSVGNARMCLSNTLMANADASWGTTMADMKFNQPNCESNR